MGFEWERVFMESLRNGSTAAMISIVLDPLADAITSLIEQVDCASAEEHSNPSAAMFVDDACGYVEHLLGAAFVVSQECITLVTAHAHRIQRLRGVPEDDLVKPADLMSLGPPAPAGGLTKIQVLNAAANFFKHNAEWCRPWSDNKSFAQRTIAAVTACGLTETTGGPFRALARCLNVEPFDRLDVLRQHLMEWEMAVATYLDKS